MKLSSNFIYLKNADLSVITPDENVDNHCFKLSSGVAICFGRTNVTVNEVAYGQDNVPYADVGVNITLPVKISTIMYRTGGSHSFDGNNFAPLVVPQYTQTSDATKITHFYLELTSAYTPMTFEVSWLIICTYEE